MHYMYKGASPLGAYQADHIYNLLGICLGLTT